jgi:glucosamine-6-phosphate deaminase
MKINILENPVELGKAAAAYCAEIINEAILRKGKARIALSTGASQFDTIKALIETNIDWSRVEMFHLDEYIDLPESHPASFRKYLKERFLSKVSIQQAYLVDGENDPQKEIAYLRVLTKYRFFCIFTAKNVMDSIKCKVCSSERIVMNGKVRSVQRYKCK